ncbi:helix-turn-helix domain-containing protein [Sphingobacterium luzhongxinii]|uniref:helix-turn-helix domain-containing protein n=1 Tax=Sphingobacterium luzhongxinii TaxID=2654181 RepID=UPI0013DA5D12|nr:helix-turn-helix transcriptional regulator [Sphingobacterium sp. xlx-73]
MDTLLGVYLDKLNINKAKVSRAIGIKRQRISDLCNKKNAKPSPEEYYKIVLATILLDNKSENEFNNSFDEVFPERPKVDFLSDSIHLSQESRFIRRHFLTQTTIEKEIKMSDGKISRLGSEDVKEVLAVELICFIEGLGLDVLKTFKEIYGDLVLSSDSED